MPPRWNGYALPCGCRGPSPSLASLRSTGPMILVAPRAYVRRYGVGRGAAAVGGGGCRRSPCGGSGPAAVGSGGPGSVARLSRSVCDGARQPVGGCVGDARAGSGEGGSDVGARRRAASGPGQARRCDAALGRCVGCWHRQRGSRGRVRARLAQPRTRPAPAAHRRGGATGRGRRAVDAGGVRPRRQGRGAPTTARRRPGPPRTAAASPGTPER